jgi:integrase
MPPSATICGQTRWTPWCKPPGNLGGIAGAAIILMLFRHGLRTAELVALRWQQVDLKASYLDVHRADGSV